MTGAEPLSLKEVGDDDVRIVVELARSPNEGVEFTSFGFYRPRDYAADYAKDRLLSDGAGVLLVCEGYRTVGFVQWGSRGTSVVGAVIEIGLVVAAGDRGRGIGARAHRLIADYLFDHTLVHRIELTTEAGNVAEQRAAERAGFIREGVLRGHSWRAGAWRDAVIYSRLRTDG